MSLTKNTANFKNLIKQKKTLTKVPRKIYMYIPDEMAKMYWSYDSSTLSRKQPKFNQNLRKLCMKPPATNPM